MKKYFFIIWLCMCCPYVGSASPFMLFFSSEQVFQLVSSVQYVQNPDSLHTTYRIELEPVNLDLIRPSMGIQFYRDGVLFLSDTRFREKMPFDHIVFGTLDTYYATWVSDSLVTESAFSSHCQFPNPPDAVSFSSDYKTMLFTSPQEGKGNLKIYRSEYEEHALPKDCKWSESPDILPFCQDQFDYFHPALSADGNILLFSSNRSPNNGKADLFVVHKTGDGWTVPISLGDQINSTENEIYPFLDREKNLFFSSDGHAGKGGYDLFVCFFDGATWSGPVNLGRKINTSENDLAIKFSLHDPTRAIYTREKVNGSRETQLIRITLKDSLSKQSGVPEGSPGEVSEALLYMAYLEHGIPMEESLQATAETAPEEAEAEPEEKELSLVSADNATDEKIVAEIPAVKLPPADSVSKPFVPTQTEEIIFRVQILSGGTTEKELSVTVNSKKYNAFAYYYKGAYRYCIGAFKSLDEAIRLQGESRQSGYPEAFVAAFRNNERITDPSVFRRR